MKNKTKLITIFLILVLTITGCKKEKAKEYTVSFDAMDIATISDVVVQEGSLIDEPMTLTKEGYDFLGWYNENIKWNFKEDRVNHDLTLTAKFEPSTYNIVYENIDGIIVDNPTTYNIETETITLNEPTKLGYNFLGWYNGEEQVTNIEKGTTGNLTLTARFELIEYKITYVNSGETVENPTTYNIETETITLNEPTKLGYHFLGWYNGEEQVTNIEKGTTGNMTLTAKFEIASFNLTIIDDGKEIVKEQVKYGTKLEKYIPTKDDYTFLGWTDSDGNKVTDTTMPAHELVLYVSWKKELTVYKINYDLNGGNWPKDVEYNTRLELVNGFLTDYGTFNNTTVNATNFFDISYNYQMKDFFTDATYSLKWGWLERYIVDLAKDTNYSGYTYLSNQADSYYNVFMRSNLDGFLNTKLHSSWPASMDFSKEQLANGYYDYMPGEETVYPTSFTYETPTFTLVNPIKDNMVFVGWYTENNELVTEIKQGTRGDISLIAHFEAAEYKITYILDGGSSEGLVTKYYSNLSEKLYLPQSKKSGYAFLGYYETADFSGTELYFIEPGSTKEYILYAKWTEEQLGSHKTISFYGDSISTFANYVPSDALIYYPIYSSTVKQVELTWWKQLMAKTGTTFHTNISYSGSTVRGTSTSCGENDTRIGKIAKDGVAPDILIIYLGINDCASGYSKENFQSSYENMLTKIKKAYPTTDIFICTLPYETWTDGSNPEGKNYPGLRESYNEVIKALAASYNVGLLDIEPCITKDTESMASRTYLGDNIHPNALGMERIANKIVECLKKFYE